MLMMTYPRTDIYPPIPEMGIEVGCGQDRELVVPSSCVPSHRRASQHWTALHYRSTPTPIAHQLWRSPHSMALTNACRGHHSNMEGVWFWCYCLLGHCGRRVGISAAADAGRGTRPPFAPGHPFLFNLSLCLGGQHACLVQCQFDRLLNMTSTYAKIISE